MGSPAKSLTLQKTLTPSKEVSIANTATKIEVELQLAFKPWVGEGIDKDRQKEIGEYATWTAEHSTVTIDEQVPRLITPLTIIVYDFTCTFSGTILT